ncbi:MAG: GGDEF domain-containing protein [Rhodocyclaceae bacterium]|nr:GGDEF domain-containing protein [Rhodocyclaceae bacterium]
MPSLDIRTLLIVFIIGNLLVGSLMLAAFRGRLTAVLKTWIASLFVQSLGWLLLGNCGGILPLLGFVTLSLSYGMMITALTLHFGISRRYGWPWWPVGIAVLFIICVPAEPWIRQVGGNLIAALQVLLAAAITLWQRGQRNLLRVLMGGSGLLGALVLLVRAADIYQVGATSCVVDGSSPEQGLTFLCFFIFRFTFMFGFILLIEGKQREAVTRLATLDSLTEAYNRRTFIDLAERELQRSLRNGRPMSVMVLDLDNFKQINDTHGHQAGDSVLQHVKQVADECLRSADIFARYGGEEFVVLLPDTTSQGAVVLAERLRLAIAENRASCGVPVTACIGVHSLDKVSKSVTLAELLAQADKAMYQAKAAGRNCVVVAD